MLNHDRHYSYSYGECVQPLEEHNNSMAPQTVGELALTVRPMGNAQGSFLFFSLDSGRIIN